MAVVNNHAHLLCLVRRPAIAISVPLAGDSRQPWLVSELVIGPCRNPHCFHSKIPERCPNPDLHCRFSYTFIDVTAVTHSRCVVRAPCDLRRQAPYEKVPYFAGAVEQLEVLLSQSLTAKVLNSTRLERSRRHGSAFRL